MSLRVDNFIIQPTAACADFTIGYIHIGSGVLTLGGTATPIASYSYAATGGLILGGDATELINYPYIVTGGLLLGGDTIGEIPTFIYGVTNGGLVLDGSAISAQQAYSHVSTGGLIVGGEADYEPYYVYFVDPAISIGSLDTLVVDFIADVLYLYSGQFTSTVKESLDVTSTNPNPYGISVDSDLNTPWIGNSSVNDILYLQSGQFTTTVKVSLNVNSFESLPQDISFDGQDTPWTGDATNKIYLQSGQFTSTIKTSQDSAAWGNSKGISFDGTNTPIAEDTASRKLQLISGQFSSTIKTSEDVQSIDLDPRGISWDGENTPWCGGAQRLYLTSGQFSSTIKTSLGPGHNTFGIESNNTTARLRLPSAVIVLGGEITVNVITYNYGVTQGGLTLGGTAKLNYTHTSTGGLTIGGEAVVIFTPNAFEVTGNGGLIVGGSSTVTNNFNYLYIATNGLTIGGTASTEEGYNLAYIASGTLIIGGQAIVAFSAWIYTTSGGLNAPYFFDDFDRADNDDLGSPWTEVTGDWDISSNELVTSSDPALAVASITQTNANYTVQADINLDTSGDSVGLVARYVSSSVYYMFLIDSESNEISIILENSGTTILASTSISISNNTDYIAKFSLYDNMLKGELFDSGDILLTNVVTTDNTITSVGSVGAYFIPPIPESISIIDPDSGAGTDYTSLSAWESAEQADLVSGEYRAVAECRSSSGTADTTACIIMDWTTNEIYYPIVRPYAGQEHKGVWNDSIYRLTDGLDLRHGLATGLQISKSVSFANAVVYAFGTTSNTRVDKCLIMGLDTSTSVAEVFFDAIITNSIILANASTSQILYLNTGGIAKNCTVIGSGTYGCRARFGTGTAINILVDASVSSCFAATTGGSFSMDSSNNASVDGTAPGANSRTSQTFTFVSTSLDDYRLNYADAGAADYGIDLSAEFTTDITGTTRTRWSIGAYDNANYEDISIVDTDSTGHYTSLSAWESDKQADLVSGEYIAVAECLASSGTADTTACTINGWTTDETYYPIVRPYAGQHSGVWNDSIYRLTINTISTGAINFETYGLLEGIQVRNTHANGYGIRLGGNCLADKMLIDAGGYGVMVSTFVATSSFRIRNSIIYNCVQHAIYTYLGQFEATNVTVQSTGGINCGHASGSLTLRNSLIIAGTGNLVGDGDITGSNNATTSGIWKTSGSGSYTGSNDRLSQTFTFVDAGNDDYHLSSSDTGAKGYGIDLSSEFTNDIDGDTRGATWDIGADQIT